VNWRNITFSEITLFPEYVNIKIILHSLYFFRPAIGTDRFLARAFVDVAASGAPVFEPFQFIHLKIRRTPDRTHAASPHIPPYLYDQKKVVLQVISHSYLTRA
jgi:hypothetical protein